MSRVEIILATGLAATALIAICAWVQTWFALRHSMVTRDMVRKLDSIVLDEMTKP